GVDIVMLDNFSPVKIEELMKQWKKKDFSRILLEASGGITADNLLDYAATGVDVISLGELTHSVKVVDISLEIVSTA
ncbi:MAG TPA: nicotinate-nucleotide diphosphorylase (carboxylating), partial [Candidatus Nanoarchaeia archaeon]|nr:nicotinate-nucleotide diphosphorylase (carboxylating) [Candidatus Nanoarchaeia archaeon]